MRTRPREALYLVFILSALVGCNDALAATPPPADASTATRAADVSRAGSRNNCTASSGTRSTVFAPFVPPPPKTPALLDFRDEDRRYRRSRNEVVTEIDVPCIGRIASLTLSMELAATEELVLGVRLQRIGEHGGESLRLVRGQRLVSRWQTDIEIGKFDGIKAGGTWRVLLEVRPDADYLRIEELDLRIRTR